MWMFNEKIDKIIDRLHQNKIDIIKLSPQKLESYRQIWFESFVPKDKREKALDSYCFGEDDGCGYLWHVFSYKILDCPVGEEANRKFNHIDKHKAVLLLNIDDVAYKINDISGFKAEDFIILHDAILTSHDFSWTFVKTHEPTCGPYFYSQ